MFNIKPDKRIPKDLRQMYGRLSSLAYEIDGHLVELKYLYSYKRRVKLLNELAPAFFMRHQRALVHLTIALLAQLTDEPGWGSRKNLSIPSLLDSIAPRRFPRLRPKLQRYWTTIDLAAGPVRNYRNKVTSHYCLSRVLSPSTELGKDITLASLRGLLTKIQKLLNTFDVFFTRGEMPPYSSEEGEADGLIRHFECAVKMIRRP